MIQATETANEVASSIQIPAWKAPVIDMETLLEDIDIMTKLHRIRLSNLALRQAVAVADTIAPNFETQATVRPGRKAA